MNEISINTLPLIEAFGYKIYFPPTGSDAEGGQLLTALGETVDGCGNMTEVFTKICKMGWMLNYKPRYRCFIATPERGLCRVRH